MKWDGLRLINMPCPRVNSQEHEARTGHDFSQEIMFSKYVWRFEVQDDTLHRWTCCEREAMFFPMFAYDEGEALIWTL